MDNRIPVSAPLVAGRDALRGAPRARRSRESTRLLSRDCHVCNASGPVRSAGFTQRYRQHGAAAVEVEWWECGSCRSWFGWPHPTPAQIARNWETTSYNDPRHAADYARRKVASQEALLDALATHAARKGALLDYGSNFGTFLEMARARGWNAVGADAFRTAVELTRAKGFVTHLGWELETLDLPAGSLDAIASNDVLYYVWHPFRHLQRAFELLHPGGALAIRTTNKRRLEGILRAITPPGPRRDRALSHVLQDQFHSMTVHTLARVLTRIGFRVAEVRSGATTAPSSGYPLYSRLVYGAAGWLDRITAGWINVSPGVCVVAVKPIAG
ncbi:bifunctional 2-polyprenyl-6-hydroxyphenol methylase/3-demethylubiquinol 3-O-methyltransferase UbiG [Anaeromyxobacter sp. Fw109-5]|uniref:class I SAM-dependent methyltransferase n=1 Tax=Anaeromyxobacter sp. (strain Fw109-5) TaxID=404589 RepID=UPI0000ED80C8|nr:methyltransferase domain-containing protein [Anaeromyxobacter sp. Fw109-5]ABS25414.1 Methyltransferase type 11 [Anaeromyxobacter sp. Fw109-5]